MKHAPAGLHFADEMDLTNFEEGCLVPPMGEAASFPLDCGGDRDALRDAFAAACHAKVDQNYQALSAALSAGGPATAAAAAGAAAAAAAAAEEEEEMPARS